VTGFTITIFVMPSSAGRNGGTGDAAACGLAGCDADESGDIGVLAQPATASVSSAASSFIRSLVLSFIVVRNCPTATRTRPESVEGALPSQAWRWRSGSQMSSWFGAFVLVIWFRRVWRRALTKFRMPKLSAGFANPATHADGRNSREKRGDGEWRGGFGKLLHADQCRQRQRCCDVEGVNGLLRALHAAVEPAVSAAADRSAG